MSAAQTYADQCAVAVDSFIQLVAALDDTQLQAITPGSGWPALLTANHVAIALRVNGSWVRRVANGEAVTATRDQIDEGNARMASEPTPPTREAVLTQLREHRAKLVQTIADLTDEQLATSAHFGPANNMMTAEQVIRLVVLPHIAEHTADLRTVAI